MPPIAAKRPPAPKTLPGSLALWPRLESRTPSPPPATASLQGENPAGGPQCQFHERLQATVPLFPQTRSNLATKEIPASLMQHTHTHTHTHVFKGKVLSCDGTVLSEKNLSLPLTRVKNSLRERRGCSQFTPSSPRPRVSKLRTVFLLVSGRGKGRFWVQALCESEAHRCPESNAFQTALAQALRGSARPFTINRLCLPSEGQAGKVSL